MPKKLEEESPEWWRAAARRLEPGTVGRAYCRVMAVAEAGHGKVLLSWDECLAMSLDDAPQSHASLCAYEVMGED